MHSASWRGCSERDGQVRDREVDQPIKGVDRRGSCNWHWIGIALALDWHCIGIALALHWHCFTPC
jgi:hypothetical protein